MREFPHLNDVYNFPDVQNVNVYQYQDSLDYERFDNYQMQITVCSVPWDLGEAHVGQRVIEGVGNVVYFNNEKSRDAWFDSLDDNTCERFNTKYRRFHSKDVIILPIPAAALVDYNYIEVKYYPEPGTGEDLDYYGDDTIYRWYYFIRDVHRKASNTTECSIMLDVWQTCIYRVNITNVNLARGHWPCAQVSTDDYLKNPMQKSEYLISDDVNFGEISRVKSTSSIVFNDDVLACFCTTTNPHSHFGTIGENNWVTPAAIAPNNGATGQYCFCINTGELSDFLHAASDYYPQFFETVKALFFVPKKLISIGEHFNLFGYWAYELTPKGATLELIDLKKEDFAYPKKYEKLAKLYTFPYAALDIYTEKGDVTRVHIEDTAGNIQVCANLQAIYPYINIDARILGVGASGQDGELTFYNASAHRMNYGGSWYEILKHWDVPTFGIAQPASSANYSTYWDRQQTLTAAANTQSNANATADVSVSNATTSANADISNANTAANALVTTTQTSADNDITNTSVQNSANTTINSTSNSSASTDSWLGNELNTALQAWNAGFTRNTTAAEIEGQQKQAAVSAAAGVIGSIASAATSGNPISAAGSIISGAISGASTMANAQIAANLAETQAELTIGNSQQQVTATNTNNTDKVNNQTSTNTSNTNTTNSTNTTITANNSATAIANAATNASATRTQANTSANAATTNANASAQVARANAQRDYNTAYSSVTNQIKGAAIRPPLVSGAYSNGETTSTRPLAAFATVVTQHPAHIAQAGDNFLRYGYRLNQIIDFNGFTVMPKFSYWECSDMWLYSSSIPDAYMDMLRMLLFGGVTVWKNPADIGTTTITGNYE